MGRPAIIIVDIIFFYVITAHRALKGAGIL